MERESVTTLLLFAVFLFVPRFLQPWEVVCCGSEVFVRIAHVNERETVGESMCKREYLSVAKKSK